MSKLGSAALNPLIKAQTAIAVNNVELRADNISEERKAELKKQNKNNKEGVEKAKSEIASKIKVVDEAENAELIKEQILKHWTKEAKNSASAHNAKTATAQKIEPVNIESVVKSATKPEKPKEEPPVDPGMGVPTPPKEKPNNTVQPRETDDFKKLGKSEYLLMKKVYQVINSEGRLDDKTKEKIKAKLRKKILPE